MPKLKNPKHELLAKNIVAENFNLVAAHQKTYPASSYASSRANVHRVLESDPLIQTRIQEIANDKGLTPEHIIEGLYEATKALKSIYYEGQKVSEVPDYSSRIEALKTGLKIYGVLNDGTTNIDARSINNYQLEQNDITMLNSTLNELKKLKRPDSIKSE